MSAVFALEIQLFGPFAARVHGNPLRQLRTRKGQWLLALLALRHPRPVDRAWLAEALWPDSLEPLHNLRQCLADLRAALGSEAGRLMSTSGHMLGLGLTGDASVDALEFDAAIRRGDLPSLETAVSQGTRVFLEDCREEWAAAERVPRELAYLSALETLAQAAASREEHAVATGYLRQAVARDSLRESARRALMQSLAAEGSLSAAQQVYLDLRALLRREMNTEPDGETTALFQRLRAQAVPPASAEAPAASCPLPPVSLTRPVGREQELRGITTALISARLVTLTGTGGIGKTLLARHTAESVPEQYPGGIWFVDLAPLAEGSAIAATVAAAVVPGKSGEEPDAALRRYLRERRGLLILDNCEHLTVQSAALARTLLETCPRLRLLATSREPLGVEGEAVYRVPSLAVDDAVRLFTERATATGVGFVLTDTNRSAVQTICRRLDGIPLALELAAARTPVLSPAQIAARLDDCFPVLAGGHRTALPRRQTLKATLDWSHGLLSPPEQTLLRRLSVFAGGWTADAAEAICAGEGLEPGDVLDLLARLLNRSLIVTEPGTGSEQRQRFLEPVRQYATGRLKESGEESAVAACHATYFLDWAGQLSPEMRGPRQSAVYAQVNAEIANLRAALDYFADARNADSFARLTMALLTFWIRRGFYKEARERNAQGIALFASDCRSLQYAALLAESGRQEDRDKALGIYRGVGDVRGIARILFMSGRHELWNCDSGKDRVLLEESLTLYRSIGDIHMPGYLYNNIAMCVFKRSLMEDEDGLLPEAYHLFEESRTCASAAGNHYLVAWAQLDMAFVLIRQGRFLEKAQDLLLESLKYVRESENPEGYVMVIEGLAGLAERRGQAVKAVRLLGAAEEQHERIDLVGKNWFYRWNDRALYACRAALPEEEFAALWAEGRALTTEQAITLGMEHGPGSVLVDRAGRNGPAQTEEQEKHHESRG